MTGPGERPPILVRPVLEAPSIDPVRDNEVRRLVTEAWARWDTACRQVPAARLLLIETARQLPEVEAHLAAATRGLEAAHAAYVRRLLGPGMLQAPTGEGTYFVHEDEELRDPQVLLARAERQKWVEARNRLWEQAANARAVIASAETQRPPGERPRD